MAEEQSSRVLVSFFPVERLYHARPHDSFVPLFNLFLFELTSFSRCEIQLPSIHFLLSGPRDEFCFRVQVFDQKVAKLEEFRSFDTKSCNEFSPSSS